MGHGASALANPVEYHNDAMAAAAGNEAARQRQELRAQDNAREISAAGVDTDRYPDPERYARATTDTRVLFNLPRQ